MLLDYAFPPHPTIEQIKSSGATAVSRYLSYVNTNTMGKILARSEYQMLTGAGIDVVLNWEYDAQDLVNPGFNASDAGTFMLSQARSIVGNDVFPAIYISADFNAVRSQWATMKTRLQAIGSKIGKERVGIYGPWDVLTWARDDQVASWFWQAGMSTSWSQGRNRNPWPGAHLLQLHTIPIGDVNLIVQPNFGQTGANMPSLDDPHGGYVFNANAWSAAIAELSTSTDIAYNNNSQAVGSAGVPFVVEFLKMRDNINTILTTVGSISGGGFSADDRTLITNLTTAMQDLSTELKNVFKTA